MTIKKPADKKVSHSREDISKTLGSRFLQLSIPSHATYLLQALSLESEDASQRQEQPVREPLLLQIVN